MLLLNIGESDSYVLKYFDGDIEKGVINIASYHVAMNDNPMHPHKNKHVSLC